MRKTEFTNGGIPGTSPEKPMSNTGEVGEHRGKVVTTTAEQPHFHTRKLAEDGLEFRALEEIGRHFLASPNYRSRVLEFAKDGSVPSSEKYVVITFQRLEEPPFGLFLLRATSHEEAQAAARAAIKAEGLHPMICFSSHLSLALVAG
jgi:hypothetical protein